MKKQFPKVNLEKNIKNKELNTLRNNLYNSIEQVIKELKTTSVSNITAYNVNVCLLEIIIDITKRSEELESSKNNQL